MMKSLAYALLAIGALACLAMLFSTEVGNEAMLGARLAAIPLVAWRFGVLSALCYIIGHLVETESAIAPDGREFLQQIADDIQWQREQKEKELHRAKAAQSNKR